MWMFILKHEITVKHSEKLAKNANTPTYWKPKQY